ncbi:MAG TPA: MogA/MoaB family molybdenum cofactor biosynthesis protein [Nocardioides sp.]|nr:MogA/MoaB family molybdenum cofactor biosynthesis protein [Nocardioides sp.]
MDALTGVVVVASTRAAAGTYQDETGPILIDFLAELGIEAKAVVVPDGELVGTAISTAADIGIDVILTTGGTGLTPTDLTPEFTRPLLHREIPGIAEALRAIGIAKGVPSAMLSRGVAGQIGQTLVINLPGSPGGVRDAIAVLRPVLEHALAQAAGGDHPRTP